MSALHFNSGGKLRISDTKVDYLANHPDLVDLLADWFYQEWGGRLPDVTLQDFSERLKGRMNRDQLPLSLVLFLRKEPIGTASLKIREMETHPQYEHWLGSVFIRGEYRKKGFGTEIVKAATRMAIRLGIEELYLYTHSSEAFYKRLGWKGIEKSIFRGRRVTIMRRVLLEGE